ncbi:GNAT family N-acetyltransferase [Massilia sp. SM-13]|uniref:GNAT family N-acetyltransferase n=1 Tax=Pseudoduganella rhizocola TaxID=3382643 RepID=UPI0038B4B1D2
MLTIRRTTEEDWASLKAVRLAALRDAPDAFGLSYATAAAWTEADWRERAACRRAEYALAFDGTQVVGMAGGLAGAGGEYELIGMWVDPACRGTSAAARLVDAIKRYASAAGHRRVVLAVAPANARAAAFYRRQGFSWLPERYPLDSNPDIELQKMSCAL